MANDKNHPTRPPGSDDFWDHPPLLQPYDTNIYGTDFDDKPLNGGWDNDVIHGYAGRDEIYGHAGRDIIHGGLGDDKIYGGSGHDVLFGEKGEDTIYGGDGNDKIYGGDGQDRLYGGSGSDVFFFSMADQQALPDLIFGFEANDKVAIQFGHGTISGSATNYAEFRFDDATAEQMRAIADFVIADPEIQHVFVSNGYNGILYSGYGDVVQTQVVLLGLGSLDEFDWTNIL